jgi:glycerate-2-kinase
VQKYITAGIKGEVKDTPKRLRNVYNFIIGDNKTALRAMARQVRMLGLRPYVISEPVQGQGEKFVSQMVRDIKKGKFNQYNALLAGGEVTFRLPPRPGRGGRNQHLAALFALAMPSFNRPWVFASLNTDGFDYIKQAAGAIVDNKTLALAQAKNIKIKDYIHSFNSYELFKKLGNALLVTGDTATNVADVMVYISGKNFNAKLSSSKQDYKIECK